MNSVEVEFWAELVQIQAESQAHGQCNGGKLQWKAAPKMFERTLVYELARCWE